MFGSESGYAGTLFFSVHFWLAQLESTSSSTRETQTVIGMPSFLASR